MLCWLLVLAGADLGIVFDTDVDRSAIVNGDGTPINSNRFIALMAAIVLQVCTAATTTCELSFEVLGYLETQVLLLLLLLVQLSCLT